MSSLSEAESIVDALKARVAARQVFIICGAGTTISATEDASLGWPDVVRHAIEYSITRGDSKFPGWAANLRQQLDLALKQDDLNLMLATAQMASDRLHEQNLWDWWVEERFGKLTCKNRDIIDAMVSLKAPILTTNYDTILEQVSGFRTVNRSEVTFFGRLANKEDVNQVGHLHGVWSQPQSMVFTRSDYEAVARDYEAGTYHRALMATGTCLFIGFGEGLNDPNFEAVRRHLLERIGRPSGTHFRLCLDNEAAELMKQSSQGVTPVPYGASHSDLPAFIRTLSAGSVDAPVNLLPPDAARENALLEIKRKANEQSLYLKIGDVSAREPLLEPVLLTAPQEVIDYHGAQSDTFRRVSGSEVVSGGQSILVVGSERSGLSSALNWLLLNKAQNDALTPLALDYTGIKHTKRTPVTDALKREASAAGVIANQREELPDRLAIGLDNLVASPRDAERVATDLRSLANQWHVFTCRLSDQADVSALLGRSGIDVRVLFLGRLTASDVARYAGAIAPERSAELTERAISVMRDEHLPPTPQTVIMLLGILASDAGVPVTSTASLVDLFVLNLIGGTLEHVKRGDLEPDDYLGILEYFAGWLACSEGGPSVSASSADFMQMLEDYQREVGWSFDVYAVLDRLVGAGVLSVRGGGVGFALASYLHLFVARFARDDNEFLLRMLNEPGTFSDALIHYTALARVDGSVLARCQVIADELGVEAATAFYFREHPEDGTRIAALSDEGPRVRQADLVLIDPLFGADQQVAPFSKPLLPAHGFFAELEVCGFVSCILGNSDQVKNVELKLDVLRALLGALERALEASHDDADYQEFASVLTNEFGENAAVRQPDVESLKEFLANGFPGMMAASILAAKLGRARLGDSLDLVVEQELRSGRENRGLVGVLLSLMIDSPRLKSHLVDVSSRWPKVHFVRKVLLPLATLLYFDAKGEPKKMLAEFIVEVSLSQVGAQGVAARQAAKSQLLTALQERERSVRQSWPMAGTLPEQPDGSRI